MLYNVGYNSKQYIYFYYKSFQQISRKFWESMTFEILVITLRMEVANTYETSVATYTVSQTRKPKFWNPLYSSSTPIYSAP